jgi:hypothetical protein
MSLIPSRSTGHCPHAHHTSRGYGNIYRDHEEERRHHDRFRESRLDNVRDMKNGSLALDRIFSVGRPYVVCILPV